MKFIIQTIAILILAFALELFLPWWSIAIAAFIMGYGLTSGGNFFAGFIAIAVLWSVKALVIDANAAVPLAEKVAAILTVSKPALIAVTALLGGLVGGFAALSGSLLKPKKSKYY
jgi:hypothetical protein